jgi:phage terminase large subunit-like protein
MATTMMRSRQKTTTGGDRPWDSWRGSRVGRYVKFVETQLVVPKGHSARKPMKLHPFQRQMFEAWLDPGLRAAMEKVGRGNAKTTTLGAFLVAHLFLEEDADVPVVASTITQAMKTTYGAALRLIQLNENLANQVLIYTGMGAAKVMVPDLNSVMYPIADKPDGLQGLDPTVAVLDEAAFASIDTWGALVQASGKRPESKCIGIGTPSFEPVNAMQEIERAWRSGQDLPSFTFIEHTAPEGCDHRDERVWPLANPGLVTKPPILGIDALRMDVAMMPEQHFRCFRLAQWPTAAAGGWLGDGGTEAWDGLTAPFEFVKGEPTWAGLDMSLRNDCSAVVAGQFRPDGRLHVKAWIWYPPEGGTVDPSEVMERVRQLDRDFSLKACMYDPRFFDLPAKMLFDERIPMVEFSQTLEGMTPAVMGCHEAIARGELSHDGDDVFRRHVLNAQPRYSDRGFTLSKSKSTGGKIDAAVALCMMHRAAAAPVPAWQPMIASV